MSDTKSGSSGCAILLVINFLLLGAAILTPLAIGIVDTIKANSAADDLRDKLIAQREAQATKVTNGSITFDHDRQYRYGRGGKMYVGVNLGSCRDIEGYFDTPDAPKRLEEVSPLTLQAPIFLPYRTTKTIKVTDPNFMEAIRATALKSCLASSAATAQRTTSRR